MDGASLLPPPPSPSYTASAAAFLHIPVPCPMISHDLPYLCVISCDLAPLTLHHNRHPLLCFWCRSVEKKFASALAVMVECNTTLAEDPLQLLQLTPQQLTDYRLCLDHRSRSSKHYLLYGGLYALHLLSWLQMGFAPEQFLFVRMTSLPKVGSPACAAALYTSTGLMYAYLKIRCGTLSHNTHVRVAGHETGTKAAATAGFFPRPAATRRGAGGATTFVPQPLADHQEAAAAARPRRRDCQRCQARLRDLEGSG